MRQRKPSALLTVVQFVVIAAVLAAGVNAAASYGPSGKSSARCTDQWTLLRHRCASPMVQTAWPKPSTTVAPPLPTAADALSPTDEAAAAAGGGSAGGAAAPAMTPALAPGNADPSWPLTPPSPPGGAFTTFGSQIIAPDGRAFTPLGVNLLGPDAFWTSATKGRSDAVKAWGFNTVRLTSCMPGGCPYTGYDQHTNDDLDGIVSEYTSKQIVVMVALHQIKPGMWPTATELTAITSWWKMIAARYKDNPYVWFNLLNEPGSETPAPPEWLAVHARLADAIRSTGASNIIVADGTQWGQDAATWDNGMVPSQNSAILTYGQQLASGRSNIVFSLHVYDQYGNAGTDAQRDARLGDFIDRVHAEGLPLLIGEAGGYADSSTTKVALGTRSAVRVAPGHGVGILFWHGLPGDGMALTVPGAFDAVNSWTNPTNLTWMGQLAWNLGAPNRAS